MKICMYVLLKVTLLLFINAMTSLESVRKKLKFTSYEKIAVRHCYICSHYQRLHVQTPDECPQEWMPAWTSPSTCSFSC